MEKTKMLTQGRRRLTRARAIRVKCLDCCCDSAAEVAKCEMKDCSLWRYRMGYEVNLRGERVTKDDKKAMRDDS